MLLGPECRPIRTHHRLLTHRRSRRHHHHTITSTVHLRLFPRRPMDTRHHRRPRYIWVGTTMGRDRVEEHRIIRHLRRRTPIYQTREAGVATAVACCRPAITLPGTINNHHRSPCKIHPGGRVVSMGDRIRMNKCRTVPEGTYRMIRRWSNTLYRKSS
jgi:hypothetical protein